MIDSGCRFDGAKEVLQEASVLCGLRVSNSCNKTTVGPHEKKFFSKIQARFRPNKSP